MGFHTSGPNEVMVISGMCLNKPKYISGGSKWVWPIIQRLQRITLNTLTLEVLSQRVYTKLGVPVSVTGVAQVKIQGQNQEMLESACQQLLGKSEEAIQELALETVEGHQRAIMGLLTVEEIYQDRSKFSDKVFQIASSDLINMGITVVSYTLKDIRDDEGYLQSLGQGRTAQVQRDARMGQSEAERDAKIRTSINIQDEKIATLQNETLMAKAKRDYELQKAEFDKEVNMNKAKADMAYSLQAAKTQQQIKEEEMEVKVIERAQQIALQQQEISRRERELEATVKRPAEAEKYRLEKIAEAQRHRIILEAQAEAEAETLRGEAEAFAITEKAKAEAEQMTKKAEAWQEYKDAALVEMLLDALPKIAAEIAAPLTSGMEKVTMISNGDESSVGPAKLTSEIVDIMTKLPNIVKTMTGVGLTKISKHK